MTFTMPSLSNMIPQQQPAGMPQQAAPIGYQPPPPGTNGFGSPPPAVDSRGFVTPPGFPAPPVPVQQPWQQPVPAPVQQPWQQPLNPAQPVPSAPFGGAASPPPGSAPVGGTQNYHVSRLEARNEINRGQFKTDEELFDSLYNLAGDLAGQLDAFTTAQQSAPPAPVAPVVPTTPQTDYSAVVPVFQQQGWLTMNNGQWVAANPVANEAAQYMNRQLVQGQQIQAELSTNPQNFISKYAANAFKDQLSPLEAQVKQLADENKRLAEMVHQNAPKPHMDWVKANDALLWANQNGTRTPTPAGEAYRDAWNLAQQSGVNDESKLHQIASFAVKPYMGQPAPQAPPQSWMQSVNMNQPVDPGFTSPGYMFNQPQAPPSPTDAHGFPSYEQIIARQNRGV